MTQFLNDPNKTTKSMHYLQSSIDSYSTSRRSSNNSFYSYSSHNGSNNRHLGLNIVPLNSNLIP